MTELEVSFIDGEKYYYPDPCPFCGSKRVEFYESKSTSGRGNFHVWIKCISCGGRGPTASSFGEQDPYQKATDDWNSRC